MSLADKGLISLIAQYSSISDIAISIANIVILHNIGFTKISSKKMRGLMLCDSSKLSQVTHNFRVNFGEVSRNILFLIPVKAGSDAYYVQVSTLDSVLTEKIQNTSVTKMQKIATHLYESGMKKMGELPLGGVGIEPDKFMEINSLFMASNILLSYCSATLNSMELMIKNIYQESWLYKALNQEKCRIECLRTALVLLHDSECKLENTEIMRKIHDDFLMIICAAAKNNDLQTLQNMLITEVMKVIDIHNLPDSLKGFSPLHYALSEGNLSCALFLMMHCYFMPIETVKTKNGTTPIQLFEKYLLAKGVPEEFEELKQLNDDRSVDTTIRSKSVHSGPDYIYLYWQQIKDCVVKFEKLRSTTNAVDKKLQKTPKPPKPTF
jgi:hypothetical protein